MPSLRAAAALGLAIVVAPAPALACAVPAPWNPAEAKEAEVVVTGRLSDYRHVPLRGSRDATGRSTDWTGGYAEVDLAVERVLVGRSPRRIRVRWHTSPLARPAPEGAYLVALNPPRPDGQGPPVFTVFERPCSSAFLLKGDSRKALAVLRVLEGLSPWPPDPPPPPALPSSAPSPALTWPAVAASWPAARSGHESRIPPVYWVVLGLVGASLAVAVGALGWRRRPRVESDDDSAGEL